MDATTILAVICCAIVFIGWLLAPHSARVETRVVISREREREREPERERERVPVSA